MKSARNHQKRTNSTPISPENANFAKNRPNPTPDSPKIPKNRPQPAKTCITSTPVKHFRTWLALWIILYALILILGWMLPDSSATTIARLSGILFCSIYSIQIFPRDYLLQLAMVTTFIADCFLACNNISVVGLMIFFLAQIVHLYRMTAPRHRPRVFTFSVIGLFVMACANLAGIFPIYTVVIFYVLALAANVIASYRWHREHPRNPYAKAALIGFILFSCCDLCTGISYLSLIHVLPAALYAPANFLAWFFYYPSQIFVSNSSKCDTIVPKEGKC